MKRAKALTIAGSDSGGGACIQEDLKTFQELKVFGMSAITAVTAQNTLGVHGVYPMSLEAIEKQLDAIAVDMGTDAIKTGMLFSSDIIELVVSKVKQYAWRQVIVDPVMIAKGGSALLQQEAVSAMKKYLLPIATVITPNIPEAEELTGIKITSLAERKLAAEALFALGAKNVIIKGGHEEEEHLTDLLFDGKSFFELHTKRVSTKNTHGTGCTFAAAVAACLAKGQTVEEAFKVAQAFVYCAIQWDLHIGNGHGPTNHWAYQEQQKNAVKS